MVARRRRRGGLMVSRRPRDRGHRPVRPRRLQPESMPLEVVNTTADHFVRRISDWRDMLEILHRGPRAVIYRPNGTLFLLLKCARLSESALGDCLALLDAGIPVDAARVMAA